MQLINFDLWGLLFGVFFFVSTCSSSVPANVSNVTLHSPETTITSTNDTDPASQLTLILLDDGIYTFEGADVTKGKLIKKENVRTTILAAKRKYNSADFIVIIKPTTKTGYSETVNLLDEMAINKIARYKIEDLSPEEKQLLKTDSHK